MKKSLFIGVGVAFLGMGMMQGPGPDPRPRMLSVSATSKSAISEWDQRIGALSSRGDLSVLNAREDTMLAGRTHTRFQQRHKGVPVWGGEIVRQEDAAGTLSVFGGLLEGIDLETRPGLGESAARSVMLKRSPVGSSFFPDEATLTVLPAADGSYALTWRARVFTGDDILMTFVDAQTGEVALEYSDKQTQSAVGTATGVLGDAKKLSGTGANASFQARDALRPPNVDTLDMKGSLARLNAIFARFPGAITSSDYAADTDNDWTDGAAVDAHVYAGYTYDYYFKRFGRRGLDNANITIRSFVHPVRREDLTLQPSNIVGTYYLNAFYAGEGVMVYGEGLPSNFTSSGQRWNYVSGALDIVAHELTHGVTDYSSRLIYRDESGALNESFSDVLGTSAEYYYQTAGAGLMRADYLVGEDVVTASSNPLSGIRSMQNPSLFQDPDHYSVRLTGTADNGGVHSNSGISNHAFYLAIEGGTHRLGARVTGVGAANREQIERVFYRAFTAFLVPSSNFAAARAATIQAAKELYPTNAAVEAAVTQSLGRGGGELMKRLQSNLAMAMSLAMAVAGRAGAQDAQPVSDLTGQAPVGASRLEVGLSFAQALGSSTFTSSQTVREFVEDGTFKGSYKTGSAPGGGFHLQYNLRERFGLRLGAQTFSRTSTGTFDAQIPHPFFLARPRSVSGVQADLKFSEAAYSLTAVYRGGSGKWRVNLEGGPAYFSVSATVAEKVSYGHVYPYDTATFSGIVSVKKKLSPLGFAVGAEVGRELSSAVSAVAQIRFTKGSGDIDVSGQKINIKAGGAQARLGLRIVLARKKVGG